MFIALLLLVERGRIMRLDPACSSEALIGLPGTELLCCRLLRRSRMREERVNVIYGRVERPSLMLGV